MTKKKVEDAKPEELAPEMSAKKLLEDRYAEIQVEFDKLQEERQELVKRGNEIVNQENVLRGRAAEIKEMMDKMEEEDAE